MVAVTLVIQETAEGIEVSACSSERDAERNERLLADQVEHYLQTLIEVGMGGPSLETACAAMYTVIQAYKNDLTAAGCAATDLDTLLRFVEEALPSQEKTRLAAG